MILLAIDPGPVRSAWLIFNTFTRGIRAFGIDTNETLLSVFHDHGFTRDLERVVIEQIASYGMPVGVEVFDTVFWSGRFAEAARPVPFDRITRLAVKSTICHSGKATDANVRQALIDHYGQGLGKAAAVGLKANPGPLHGIANDVWAALAVAFAYGERIAA